MTADYDMPSAVEKRVRFFDGQYLQDQDFVDEQKYHLDRERRHLRLLHGPGIAEGLAVAAGGPNQVTVAPGTAVDSDGRLLVLADSTTVDLPAQTLNGRQGIELYLSYQETKDDEQTQIGGADFTRWLERPVLAAVAPDAAYASVTPPVLLARLSLDNAGRVAVDASSRAYAGLRLPGPDADAPTLHTAQSGRVSLAGSLVVDGDLGVGTAQPASRLHVDVPSSTMPVSAMRIDVESFVTMDNAMASHFLAVRDVGAGGAHFYIRGDGNIGMGTTTPGARLEVVGAGKDNVDLLVNGRLRSNNNDGGLWISSDRLVGGHSKDKLGLYNGGDWRLTVTKDGNVGIGTTTPGARLEVVGGGKSNVDLVVNGRLRSNNNDGGMWISSDRLVGGHSTDKLGLYNGGDWRLTVTKDGKVGIGTLSPVGDLEIGSLDYGQDRWVTLKVGGGNKWRAGLKLWAYKENAGYSILFDERNSANGLHIRTHDEKNPDGTTRLFLNRQGNLGIGPGVTDPGDKLRLVVAGPSWFQGDVFVGRLIFQTGGSSTGWRWLAERVGFHTLEIPEGDGPPSDLRLKAALRPLGQALDAVRRLQGMRYRWNDRGIEYLTRDVESLSGGPGATEEQERELRLQERRRAAERLSGDRLGLVAQDVEAVVPELVHDGGDGYKRVRYQHLTALLVEAIKEQDALVARLSARVAALENRGPGRAGSSGPAERSR